MNTIDAKTYRPRADSLAAQVVAFFAKHPEEDLHISDIAIKFDAAKPSIHACLKAAVDCDLLKRNNSLYSAGVNIEWAPESAHGTAAAAPKAAPRGHASPRLHLDISKLQVETGVPYVPFNTVKGQSKWEPLFAKLTAAGQSVPLPGHMKGALAAAILLRNKQKNGTFRIAMTSANEARIWRTA
jgi:hypothetical protein